MRERGNPILRWFDSNVGPVLLALLAFRKWRRSRPTQIQTIGVLKPAALGDLILLSAVITDLKKWRADSRVILFVSASNAELGHLLADVDEVVELSMTRPWQAVRVLRQYALDILIDADAWPRISALLVALSRATWRLGFKTAGQRRHFAYDQTVEHRGDVHEIENYRSLLRALQIPAGLPPQNFAHLRLSPPAEPWIALHLWPGGTQSHLKEWPETSWIELMVQLHKTDSRLRFLLTGGRADREKNEMLAARLPNEIRSRTTNLGGLSLRETMTQLLQCGCVVAVNSGIMHLAAALGVPTVGLHGPTNPRRWGPIGPSCAAVVSKTPGAGQLHLGFGWRIADVRILPQNPAQIATGFVAAIPQDVVGHFERNILAGVGFQSAGHVVVGRSQRLGPEDCGRLQCFVGEAGQQERSQDDRERVSCRARAQTVNGKAQNQPEHQSEGAL